MRCFAHHIGQKRITHADQIWHKEQTAMLKSPEFNAFLSPFAQFQGFLCSRHFCTMAHGTANMYMIAMLGTGFFQFENLWQAHSHEETVDQGGSVRLGPLAKEVIQHFTAWPRLLKLMDVFLWDDVGKPRMIWGWCYMLHLVHKCT